MENLLAKDLRIGNLIKWVDDETQVIPITAIRLINFSVGMEDIEPIPLTEKWLNVFGFKKKVLSDDSEYYYTLELNDNKYCDLAIISGDKNGFIEVTLFPYEEWFMYKYVHELQNLFFAITGTELELKTDV